MARVVDGQKVKEQDKGCAKATLGPLKNRDELDMGE